MRVFFFVFFFGTAKFSPVMQWGCLLLGIFFFQSFIWACICVKILCYKVHFWHFTKGEENCC